MSFFVKHLALFFASVLLAVTSFAQDRSKDPVTFKGTSLPCMLGKNPKDLVGFRFDASGQWVQIPIQIDEMLLLDVATPYGDNDCLGGSDRSIPWNVPFYADTSTYVGADTSLLFDADDELSFMAKDVGGLATSSDFPERIFRGSVCLLKVIDVLDSTILGYVYVFVQDGSLRQDANMDYVDYNFVFYPNGDTTEGQSIKEDYIACYDNQNKNTENSLVNTADYEVGFISRWEETVLKIKADQAIGEDILDLRDGTSSLVQCIRNTKTYTTSRGTIVNAIDGPIRAIRSVMGTNSGMYNQLTIVFTASRVDYTNDFRVHNVENITSSVYEFFDFNDNYRGASYSDALNPTSVIVNGNQDVINTSSQPEWAFYQSGQGSIAITYQTVTSLIGSNNNSDLENGSAEYVSSSYYDDSGTRTSYKCTGDRQAIGASGSFFSSNKCFDRRYITPSLNCINSEPNEIAVKRFHYYLSPNATSAQASRYAEFAKHPLRVEQIEPVNFEECQSVVFDNEVLADGSYVNYKSIEASSIIVPNAVVVFEADSIIVLKNRFSASNGSAFTAKIVPCLLPSVIEIESREQARNVMETSVQMKLFPNPTSTSLNVAIASDRALTLNFDIFNVLGELTPISNIQKSVGYGDNEFSIAVQTLPAGMYLLMVRGEKVKQVHRFLIID